MGTELACVRQLTRVPPMANGMHCSCSAAKEASPLPSKETATAVFSSSRFCRPLWASLHKRWLRRHRMGKGRWEEDTKKTEDQRRGPAPTSARSSKAPPAQGGTQACRTRMGGQCLLGQGLRGGPAGRGSALQPWFSPSHGPRRHWFCRLGTWEARRLSSPPWPAQWHWRQCQYRCHPSLGRCGCKCSPGGQGMAGGHPRPCPFTAG